MLTKYNSSFFSGKDGNTLLHHAIMNLPDETEDRHEFAALGLEILDPAHPLEGEMATKLQGLPREAARKVKKNIAELKERMQCQVDMLDILLRVGFANPLIQNANGLTCVNLTENKWDFIIQQVNEGVLQQEWIQQQEALRDAAEHEDLDNGWGLGLTGFTEEPYEWKFEHTDIGKPTRLKRSDLLANIHSGTVRVVCSCGNILMKDAKFCRMCGEKREVAESRMVGNDS